MSSRSLNVAARLDWTTLLTVGVLVVLGWLNIVSATAEAEVVWDMGGKAGKQLIWMGVCAVLMVGLLAVEGVFYIRTSVVHYAAVMLLLMAVLVVGKKVGGARSWFGVGSFGIQPSEFAKTATALILAWFLSRDGRPWRTFKTRLQTLALIAAPAGLILLQPDAGTVLVFGGFIFVLYREGLSGNVLLVGVGMLVLAVLTILLGASESWYPFLGSESGFWWFLLSLALLGTLTLLLVRAATLPRRRKAVSRWGSRCCWEAWRSPRACIWAWSRCSKNTNASASTCSSASTSTTPTPTTTSATRKPPSDRAGGPGRAGPKVP